MRSQEPRRLRHLGRRRAGRHASADAAHLRAPRPRAAGAHPGRQPPLQRRRHRVPAAHQRAGRRRHEPRRHPPGDGARSSRTSGCAPRTPNFARWRRRPWPRPTAGRRAAISCRCTRRCRCSAGHASGVRPEAARRQIDREVGAAIRVIGHGRGAVMRLGDRRDDRQPEPGLRPDPRRVGPPESVEGVLQRFVAEPGTVVANGHERAAVAAPGPTPRSASRQECGSARWRRGWRWPDADGPARRRPRPTRARRG